MKYTKPDLRISPLWQTSPTGCYIYRVREDHYVKAVLGSDGSSVSDNQPWQFPHGTEWTPVVPYGTTPRELPLVIEPGNWYETRGGDKAFVGFVHPCRPDNKFIGAILGSRLVRSWFADGRYISNISESDYDLIRETEAP